MIKVKSKGLDNALGQCPHKYEKVCVYVCVV